MLQKPPELIRNALVSGCHAVAAKTLLLEIYVLDFSRSGEKNRATILVENQYKKNKSGTYIFTTRL